LTVFGTNGSLLLASMIGCLPSTISSLPGSSTIVGRTQFEERATREREKRQSAVEREVIVVRKRS
jgi:hypothetical protein